MSESPMGEKRQADTIVTAIKMSRIVNGEINGKLEKNSIRTHAGKASRKARAEKYMKEERSNLANFTAAARGR